MNITDNSSDNVTTNSGEDNEHYELNTLLSNARSLSPKIKSLIINFEEVDLHVAIITESWLADGEKLDRDLEELEGGTGLKMILRNHEGKRKRRGV